MSTTSPLDPLLQRLCLHGSLDAAEQAAVHALPHTVRTIESGHFIVREGDRPTHCCLVLSGFAIRHKVAGNGKRQIVNVHMAGDMVDLQNSLLSVADHDVGALTTLKGAFIPREAIVDVAFAHPAVGKALWLETLIEGSISREWITNVGRRDSQRRLAHLLCEFAYRLDAVGLGPECNYELPMTQEDLADTVGLTAVHVNRSLRALDAAGLTQRTRRSVVIKDLEKLARFSDFRSNYLHLPSHALPQHLQ